RRRIEHALHARVLGQLQHIADTVDVFQHGHRILEGPRDSHRGRVVEHVIGRESRKYGRDLGMAIHVRTDEAEAGTGGRQLLDRPRLQIVDGEHVISIAGREMAREASANVSGAAGDENLRPRHADVWTVGPWACQGTGCTAAQLAAATIVPLRAPWWTSTQACIPPGEDSSASRSTAAACATRPRRSTR